MADKVGMETDGWRGRLSAALEQKGLSMRAVSLKAQAGPGYVFSILREGKDPTIDKLIAVCAAIPVSLSYILYGVEISREDEEIIRAIQEGPEKRDAVLTLLRGRPKGG